MHIGWVFWSCIPLLLLYHVSLSRVYDVDIIPGAFSALERCLHVEHLYGTTVK